MQRITPATNEIYHVYNRGVDKRNVFMDDVDFLRFIHDLFEFNDEEPSPNINYHFSKASKSQQSQAQSMEVKLPYFGKNDRQPRKFLVEIIAFCLMPNHFHLLIKQRVEMGISKFMSKLGTGYTNYFNQKYQRTGSLFQGSYKSIVVKDESHFIHLPYYIHANPLDLTMPNWRNKEISSVSRAIKSLENYRWSSFLDYIGKKNFPSVTQRESLLGFFNGTDHYKKAFINWLSAMNIEELGGLIMEV